MKKIFVVLEAGILLIVCLSKVKEPKEVKFFQFVIVFMLIGRNQRLLEITQLTLKI